MPSLPSGSWTPLLVALCLVLGLAPASWAQEALHFTMVSYHLDRTPGGGTEPPNEVNPGVGVEWKQGRGAVHLGGYYNTIRTVSLYAGYERHLFDDRWARAGAVAGLVTGYPIFEVAPGLSIMPGATPFAELGRGPVRPRLYVLPFRGGVIAVQLRMLLP